MNEELFTKWSGVGMKPSRQETEKHVYVECWKHDCPEQVSPYVPHYHVERSSI